jgi:ArsR family metal-binding transcriptional regulator
MLITDYDLEIFTPPCDPGAERWTAIARFKGDISEVLPYLNAIKQGAIYNHAAHALTWKESGHSRALRAHEIAVSNLEDRTEAEQLVRTLVDTVNRTWDRRAEIEPNFETRQRPAPMTILKLLPGTNCRECGQPTCFTFALKVAAGQQKPGACPPLLQPEFAEQLAELRAIIDQMPGSE